MEMLHPNPRQPGRGGPCHRVAAPVPLHADRGDGRTYIAADRRRSGETSTHGGLTNGHLKRHLNLHLLDGRDHCRSSMKPSGALVNTVAMGVRRKNVMLVGRCSFLSFSKPSLGDLASSQSNI